MPFSQHAAGSEVGILARPELSSEFMSVDRDSVLFD